MAVYSIEAGVVSVMLLDQPRMGSGRTGLDGICGDVGEMQGHCNLHCGVQLAF